MYKGVCSGVLYRRRRIYCFLLQLLLEASAACKITLEIVLFCGSSSSFCLQKPNEHGRAALVSPTLIQKDDQGLPSGMRRQSRIIYYDYVLYYMQVKSRSKAAPVEDRHRSASAHHAQELCFSTPWARRLMASTGGGEGRMRLRVVQLQ